MGYISSLLQNPRATILMILLALPGRMLALSLHEYAHARAAYKCGDNTAAMMGRMTINPLKHIDVLGFLMLYLVGFGWAKPVPVNPRNFKGDFRKCDFVVSIAGITMNLILFLAGGMVMFLWSGLLIKNMVGPEGGEILRQGYWLGADFVGMYNGRLLGYLFEMLSYFVQINIVLAVFNLFPIPPLDGYQVLNDLVLRRNTLFASQRAEQVGYIVMLALLFSGILGEAISFVTQYAYQGLGTVVAAILGM